MNADARHADKADPFEPSRKSIQSMIVAGAQLDEVLAQIVLSVEKQCREMFCSTSLVDLPSRELHFGAAPSLPAAYRALLRSILIGEGVGSCGTAAHRRRLVVVHDIASDPLWAKYKGLALPHGLRACWCLPIWSRGEVVGVFASYYKEPRSPSDREVLVVEVAAALASVAIARRPKTRTRGAASSMTKTVLVVDDDADFRKMTLELLEMDGHTTLEASDAQNALSICRKHPERIHLILTDVEMPQMDGFALSEEIRQLRPDAKILFMSGRSRPRQEIQASQFLSKPFGIAELRQRIDSVFTVSKAEC